MGEKKIKRLSYFDVFLSAVRAESFFHNMLAVQAVFLFSQYSVAHLYNFSQNKKKQESRKLISNQISLQIERDFA